MRQRKIKNIEAKIDIFSEPLVYDPASSRGRWRDVFGVGEGNGKDKDKSGDIADFMDSGDGLAPGKGGGNGASRPLYLEIGCGKGRFIAANALAHPESLYLGFEGHQSVLYRALQRAYAGPDAKLTELDEIATALAKPCDGDCAHCGQHGIDSKCGASGDSGTQDDNDVSGAERKTEGLSEVRNPSGYDGIFEPPDNLRLCAEYILDMRDFFADGELNGIYLNFSDPWPKARQEKRRLTSPRYLDGYQDVLAENGFLRFKTDNKDFFAYSRASIENHPGFEITGLTNDLHDSAYAKDNVMTEYERRYLNLQKKINYLEAVKSGSDAISQ